MLPTTAGASAGSTWTAPGELAAGVGRDYLDVLARLRRLDHLAGAQVAGDG